MRQILFLLIGILLYSSVVFATVGWMETDLRISVNATDDGCIVWICPEEDCGKDYIEIDEDDLPYNKSKDLEVYIDFECEGWEMKNLTDTLIRTNTECVDTYTDVIDIFRSTNNLSQEFINCVDGRARAATIHETCREEKAVYKNSSDYYEGKYGELGTCQNTLTTTQNNYNTCSNNKDICDENLEDERKSKNIWLVVGIIIGGVIVWFFMRQQGPKIPEFDQFGEQG